MFGFWNSINTIVSHTTAAMFDTIPAVEAATLAIAARLYGKGFAAAIAIPCWIAITD
ncbi:Uncharacterised protein [Klebsiella pneumoniae]|uniref:Uncharacterized protein n=1 Tax=Klebsiella pneumoniae TaxID=573 RepID=A0A378A1S0_KLEPN|nr:Uncharacterised protein [Klebsiella pneumoniae]